MRICLASCGAPWEHSLLFPSLALTVDHPLPMPSAPKQAFPELAVSADKAELESQGQGQMGEQQLPEEPQGQP